MCPTWEELPDDDSEAIAELTGQPRSRGGHEDRLGTAPQEITHYRGVKRRCSGRMLRDPEATIRFMDAVDNWKDGTAPAQLRAQHIDRITSGTTAEFLGKLERGEIKSINDVPEGFLVSQLMAVVLDPRRPQVSMQALKELARLKSEADAAKVRGDQGAETLERLKQIQQRTDELRASHARIRAARGSSGSSGSSGWARGAQEGLPGQQLLPGMGEAGQAGEPGQARLRRVD